MTLSDKIDTTLATWSRRTITLLCLELQKLTLTSSTSRLTQILELVVSYTMQNFECELQAHEVRCGTQGFVAG